MKIAIACDHRGYEKKEALKKYLEEKGYKIVDFGTFSSESTDYPDYAHPMAEAVERGDCEYGITLCGSGNGINITANKHQGIRAAYCWNEEIAALARKHNNANVCSMPADFITEKQAFKFIDIFLSTEFEGGRHERRVKKIPLWNVEYEEMTKKLDLLNKALESAKAIDDNIAEKKIREQIKKLLKKVSAILK